MDLNASCFAMREDNIHCFIDLFSFQSLLITCESSRPIWVLA